MTRHFTSTARTLSWLAALPGLATLAAAQCNPEFRPGLPVPGVDGPVTSLLTISTESGDTLLAGGSFLAAGGVVAPGVATFDGVRWAALGAGLPNPAVTDLAIHKGVMYAADKDAVYRWTGEAWEPLPASGLVKVNSLEVSGGLLYAGGIPAEGGPALLVLGEMGFEPTRPVLTGAGIVDMTDHKGVLVVAGDALTANGVPESNVLALSGEIVSPIGAPLTGEVMSVAAIGGEIAVLGVFEDLFPSRGSDDPVAAMLCYENGRWETMPLPGVGSGSALISGTVRAVDGVLYASTTFVRDDIRVERLGRVDLYADGAWSPVVDETPNLDVRAMTSFGGTIAMGGPSILAPAGWDIPRGIALLDDTRLRTINDGEGRDFAHFTLFGGTFAALGSDNRVVVREGSTFIPVGPAFEGRVNTLVEFNGMLVAVGGFSGVGVASIPLVAASDGVSWFPLGGGLTGPADAEVLAAAVHDGKLYVSGTFAAAGEMPVEKLVAFDGSAWIEVPNPFLTPPTALASFGGKLIAAGGTFYDIEVRVPFGTTYASFDGEVWTPIPVPEEMEGLRPTALTLWGDRLVSLATAGGGWSALDVYDGSSWSRLPTTGAIASIAVVRNELFIARAAALGGFAVGTPKLERWNPLFGFDTLLAGDDVTAIGALGSFKGELLLGGSFGRVGTTVSAGFARFACASRIDLSGDGAVDLADLFAFFAAFDTTSPLADIDASGTVDLIDFFEFFSLWDNGG